MEGLTAQAGHAVPCAMLPTLSEGQSWLACERAPSGCNAPLLQAASLGARRAGVQHCRERIRWAEYSQSVTVWGEDCCLLP